MVSVSTAVRDVLLKVKCVSAGRSTPHAMGMTPTRQRQRLLLHEVLAVQLHRLQRRHYTSPRLLCPTRLQRQRALLHGVGAQPDVGQLGVLGEEHLRLSEALVVGGEVRQRGQVRDVERVCLGEVVAVELHGGQRGQVWCEEKKESIPTRMN